MKKMSGYFGKKSGEGFKKITGNVTFPLVKKPGRHSSCTQFE